MRFIAIATSVICLSASAQECEKLITLSKTVSSTVADKSTFDKHAANFCSEYKRGGSSSAATNAGASWKFISASFGQSSMTTEEVASKVCSASSGESASTDAYRQYVETIASGAYAAYETCIKLKDSNDLRFDVDLASVLPSEFTIVIAYQKIIQGTTTADLIYSASKGISCTWNGKKAATTSIDAPSSVLVKCSRTDQGQAGYAKFIRTNGVGGSITIPWPAYDANGIPLATLESIRGQITTAQSSITDIKNWLMY
ncbi:hypothetical protein LepocDRAFT_00005340 [Leptothrix ochracea L12]|uniref:Uncharacterized protein n=1 Tax=Leptothrix ochracea L12 TaxID=735332 RepID=I4Z6F0_9BURK|nr:hypothetical protein [Leptothrix ochracea]EIM31792.1 hypothetical protein LepocDRAFT_00005340 [Leptothrix ochracea L12]